MEGGRRVVRVGEGDGPHNTISISCLTAWEGRVGGVVRVRVEGGEGGWRGWKVAAAGGTWSAGISCFVSLSKRESSAGSFSLDAELDL